MSQQKSHLTDEVLLGAADGELTSKREVEVRAHLAACWSCRTRLAEIERTIADFVESRANVDPLPPASRGRSLLRAQMAEAAKTMPADIRFWQLNRFQILAIACAIFLPIAFLWTRNTSSDFDSSVSVESRAIPDPRLTPGAVLPVTRDDVCTAGSVETVKIVPTSVAQAVFAEYGIRHPRPRAYEVDYLITPALGGSDNVRNFWPQSYRETVWNAHIKDALEDYLHDLVCAGELDLVTAQQDISRNWVAAYKKYFHTINPLPQHSDFLKDRPWE